MSNNELRAEIYTRAGGPAFPLVDEGACVVYGGMTLRDYFAAKAFAMFPEVVGATFADATTIAKAAYEIADAMLKARDA